MKLRKATRTLLQLVAPDWMGKLDKVDWHATLLRNYDRVSLANKVSQCFMGEIYCYTNAYCSGGDKECFICKEFCGAIPSVLQYSTEDSKKEIMQSLVDHLRKKHKQLILNKKAGKD